MRYFDQLSDEGGAVYDEEHGMIYGSFTDDSNAEEFIDLTKWHTEEEQCGCKFDSEAYSRDNSSWREDKPDLDDFEYYDSRWNMYLHDFDEYRDAYDAWQENRPDRKEYYYCPGHQVTFDYGHRDLAVYIPVYTLQDIFDDEEFIAEIKNSAHYNTYKKYISQFIEEGGFQQEDDRSGLDYKGIVKSYLDSDWGELYEITGETQYNNAFGQKSSSGFYTPEDDPYHLNEGDSNIVSDEAVGTRDDVVRAAEACVGRISYYWGGKPSSADFDSNHFGTTIKADYKGRSRRGLDCSGFVDYAFWQVGIYPVCKGMGTGGVGYLDEFYDAKKLQPGDLGMHHSYSGAQGGSNHIGIFYGYNEDGDQVWIACGSHGVCKYVTNEFKVYYDTGGLFG